MTARVDTQTAKERAENVAGAPIDETEAQLARDVIALVGLLADAEKALREIATMPVANGPGVRMREIARAGLTKLDRPEPRTDAAGRGGDER